MASLGEGDTSDFIERVQNTNASLSKDQSGMDMSMASLNDISATEMDHVQEDNNEDDDEN